MNFLKFLSKRLASIVIALVAVVTITFYLMHAAPGNFMEMEQVREAKAAVDSKGRAAQQQYEREFKKRYALDKPIYMQVGIFLKNAAMFKFGPSFGNPNVAIETLIASKFAITLQIVTIGLLLALLVGVPMGVIAALKKNTVADYSLMGLSLVGQVIPSFVIAVGLIVLFSVVWGVLPTSGWGMCKHLILPALAIGAAPIATVARFIRSSILETLEQDYIRTAYSKGLPEATVVITHALRNSLIPLVTVMGPQFSFMLLGSVLVEQVFRIPGLGSMFVSAAQMRDYPMLVTSTLIFAAAIMFINLAVDMLYAVLDPRIKLE
ncbi:MAG: peptide transporter permease [Fibrobacteres bacterium]|nr:peptide transporter permease [Fibrobacterota bacterium]